MPRGTGHVVAVAGAIAAFTLCSCSERALPGNVLGRYKVTGQAQANSCGLGAPATWIFRVELSEDRSVLYWSWLDGTPPISSALTTPSQATLTGTTVANVDPSDAGRGPCTLQRDDHVAVILGTGSPPGTFSGTVAYQFSPASGSSCGDQLASVGGPYQALPCSVSYTVNAAREGD